MTKDVYRLPHSPVQDLINESYDPEIGAHYVELVGTPENFGSGSRTMYPVKVDSDGSLMVSIAGGGTGGSSGGSTEDEQLAQTEALKEIRSAIQTIASARGIAADLRVTILGGTTAVTTVTTVTTVGTVTGITNIGGLPATQLIPSNQNLIATMANINNVGA